MGQQAGPLSDNGEILIASEIARWLRIGISTVYQWAHAGTIPCIRLNGVLRFHRKDVQAWLTAQQMPASQGAKCLSRSRAKLPPISTDLLQRTARHVLRQTTDTAKIHSEKTPSLGKKQG
jgi:excisionase family DNA binding protein